jgi:spore coat protein U-like protein
MIVVERMRIRSLYSIMMVFILLAFALPAGAFNCNVNVTGLSFGGYDVFSAIPKDSTATVTVTCNAPPQNPTAPVPVVISLSPGNSGSFAQRRLQRLDGPDRLAYNLFTTPAFSTVWGDGSGGSQTQTNLVTKDTPWTANIYGRIPAGQNVSAGSYSDVITVTIEW